jgi:hypothetical protein
MQKFKNLFTNHKVRKAQIYTKASWYSADSNFYKSWSPGVGWDHKWKTIFTCVNIGGKSLKIFSRASRAISIKLGTNHPCIKGIQVYTNKEPGHLQSEIIAKIGWGHLIFLLSRTTGPEKLKFTHESFLI